MRDPLDAYWRDKVERAAAEHPVIYTDRDRIGAALTEGQEQVRKLVLAGLTSPLIAERLSISVHTVATRRAAIRGKGWWMPRNHSAIKLT